MNHEEWLANKKTYIGGSEAAAILGLSKWMSPLSVYLNKRGEGIEVEDNDAMYFGRMFEEFVINEYGKRTGFKVEHNKQQDVYYYNDFIGCTPDGFVWCPKRGKGVIEAKTANEYMKDEWSEIMAPEQYVIQVYHNMACCKVTWGVIPVLIGGNKFLWVDFDWDDELISIIIQKEKKFWYEHVMKGIPPEATGASLDVLSKLYPKDAGTSIILHEDKIGDAIRQYLDTKVALDHLTKKHEDAKATIQAAMGDAAQGIYHDGDVTYGVSWSSVKGRLGFDSKSLEAELPEIYKKYVKVGASYRRFSVKEKVAKIGKSKKEEITHE